MKMLKAVTRACLKLFKWLLAIAAVLIAVLFTLNAADESLKPEAAAALRWPEPTVKDSDNGYFAMVGLSAPSGQDGHAWGRRWIEEMNRAHSRAEVEAVEKALATAPLTFAGASNVLCNFRAEQACAPQAATNAEAIDKLTADNAELLRRYSALRGFPKVVDVYRPQSLSHPIIGLSIYNNAQRLLLSQRLASLESGTGDPALAVLADDVDLQRKVLAGATSLPVKAVANAALARDYLALSEIIRKNPRLAGEQATTMRRILAPLSAEELALAPAIMTELRVMAASLDDPAIADPASYLFIQILSDASAVSTPPTLKASVFDGVALLMKETGALLLQKNATRNRLFETMLAIAALDEVPGHRLGDATKALSAVQDEGISWSWVYNPIGKLFLSVAMPSFTDHKLRLVDLEGLRRLAVLQETIAASGIADADIPAFLAKSGNSLADPCTNKPMRWDAEKHVLFFETAGNSRWFAVSKNGRISIPF